MHDVLDAQIFPVAINLLVCRQEKLVKHFLGNKEASLASPVIVMEQDLRLHIFKMLIGDGALPVSHVVDQLVHSFRLLVEVDHGIFHAHQIVAFLKHTAEHLCCREVLVLIDCLKAFDAVSPRFRTKVHVRCMHGLSPVGDIRADLVIAFAQRECSRNSLREFLLYAPAVCPFGSACRNTKVDREQRIIQPCLILILLHKTVWISAFYSFNKVLFYC